jgi:THUMP domain-like/RNA cap guanine-N2 methyltransferase
MPARLAARLQLRHQTKRDEAKGEVDVEAWVLSTEPGQRLLAEAAALRELRPAEVQRLRKLAPPEAVAAGLRLAACQAKARAKFSQGERMWLDPVGLEQATSEPVALHKAARFPRSLVVDLCAGVGGDSLALAQRAHVLAVDRSQANCRRLAWNAAVHGLADRILPCRGLAEAFPIPAGAWVHIDPDRRVTRSDRARTLADYAPGLAFLRSLAQRAPAGAIKLSPASDFATTLSNPDLEIELISLDGECKEATVWFGAAATCRRRATRLPEGITWTDRDGACFERFRVPTAAVAAYVYDPDPALPRAGLLDSFTAAHGLCRIADDVDYLTSESLLATAFLTPFEVQGVFPLDLKRLRRLVAQENLGPLEIKLRGLDLLPEKLRDRLHPRGSRPATLILVGGSGPARAILARRLAGVS